MPYPACAIALAARFLERHLNATPLPLCPRCRRANPAAAWYCHFDGTPLRAQPGLAPGALPHEFVFPSGRACRTYDDLVRTCQDEWDDARRLLKQGVFSQYLAGAGRLDLAEAARKAQAEADADIALHNFLGALPAGTRGGPKLDLQPRRLVLGAFRAGEARAARLNVTNVGKGLLHGTVTVSEGADWLRLAGPGVTDPRHCTLKTAREQPLTVQVDTRGLAARRNYSACLTVITNGGVAEVPVSAEVAALPFPRPPFQGAGSPRDLAERMRANPKPAGPLLENGEVARWFTANGWVYPVPFATATGVAAVQQFFEGMGLAKPPPVELSEAETRFLCVYPEMADGAVTLRTPARKWVYAQVESDVPWLRVKDATVSGPQHAAIAYTVDSGLLDAGRMHEGNLHVMANAGQRLSLHVVVDVREPQVPFTRRLLRPFFTVVLLALVARLLLAVPADLFARVLAAPPGGDAGSFDTWLVSPLARLDLAVPFIRHFVLATWWLGAVAGGVLLWRRSRRPADVLCGTVAGAVAGVLGSATFACIEPWVDGPARALLRLLAGTVHRGGLTASPWLWTPAWVLLVVLTWGVLAAIPAAARALALRRGTAAGAASPKS